MVAAAAALAAPAPATPMMVVIAVIGRLLTVLIMILSGVAVLSSRVHSTRALKVLALLTPRTKPDSPKGGEGEPK